MPAPALVAGLAAAVGVVIRPVFAGTVSQWRRAEAARKRRCESATGDEQRAWQSNFRQAREAVDTLLDASQRQRGAQGSRTSSRCAGSCCGPPGISTSGLSSRTLATRDLQAELGKAHERLGLITAILESWPKSAASIFRRWARFSSRLHEAYPDDAAYQRSWRKAISGEGNCLRAGAGTTHEAEAAFRRAAAGYRTLWCGHHPDEPAYQIDLARTLRSLGNLYLFMTNDHGRAEQSLLAARGALRSFSAGPCGRAHRGGRAWRGALNLAKLYGHSDRPRRADAQPPKLRFAASSRWCKSMPATPITSTISSTP